MPYFSPRIANLSPRHVDSMSLVFLQYVQNSYFLCHYYNTVLESLCWTLEQQFICSFPSVLSSPRYAPPTARVILLKASLIRSHPCLKLFCHCPESKVQIFNMFHKTLTICPSIVPPTLSCTISPKVFMTNITLVFFQFLENTTFLSTSVSPQQLIP